MEITSIKFTIFYRNYARLKCQCKICKITESMKHVRVSRDGRVNQTYPIRLLFSSFIVLTVSFYGLKLPNTYEIFQINTILQ